MSLTRLAALFAVLCQLVLGQPVFATEAAAPTHVCSVDQHQAPAHHHGMDCLRCPFCAMVVHAALTPRLPMLPAPPVVLCSAQTRLPQARAPPGRALLAAYPRGPPSLS